MAYKEIAPEFWDYSEKGDKIEGILISKEEDIGVNKSNTYLIETKDKKSLLIWGTTVLDNKMKYVDLGDKIRITFFGIIKNKKQQDMKIFKVEVDKEED